MSWSSSSPFGALRAAEALSCRHQAGFRLHNADAAIAGCAVRAGAARIVTADADLVELRGIAVEYVQPS